MNRGALLLFAWLMPVVALAAGEPPLPTIIGDPLKLGQELASRLRTLVPTENTEFTGALKVAPRDGEIRTVPLAWAVKLGTLTNDAPNWEAVFRTQAAGGQPAERMVIRYQAGRTNDYFHLRGEASARPPGPAARVTGEGAHAPLAGSDFWLTDLGLEFLHWPTQRLVKVEMRRSRPCRVLESIRPSPQAGGYARVLSWIDVESDDQLRASLESSTNTAVRSGFVLPPLLRAEAYDAQNRLVKEFSLGSFKKVEGQWQLQEMKMRNVRTGSRTWIEFDLKR